MPLILTIDVEDWAQSTLNTDLPITDRAQRNMEHLLDLLATHSRRATCFVLGKFAERFPKTVKRIAQEGHEVASHGYGHVDVFKMSPVAFRDDILRSKAQLEDLTGQPIIGYRAPDFSIIKNALWALDELQQAGFIYDSSINPAVVARFGIPAWPNHPTAVDLGEDRSIFEFPVATWRIFGRDWPVAGGGYHRLLPGFIIRTIIRRALVKDEIFTAYCHPYEFDPSEFKYLQFPIPRKIRFHQGLGRRGFETKFVSIMQNFETKTIRQVLDDEKEIRVFIRESTRIKITQR